MDTKNDLEPSFESISSAGKEYFSEFLTDLSRKRQTGLLTSAVITILLAFTIITPVEGTFAGIKFGFPNTSLISLLSGVICLYFLVIYLLGVWQDWHYSTYRLMPSHHLLHSTKWKVVSNRLDDINTNFEEKNNKDNGLNTRSESTEAADNLRQSIQEKIYRDKINLILGTYTKFEKILVT